jgi:peptidoglycan pentaglycine glycine transferase (the first glycine)
MDSELCWVLDLNIASEELLRNMRKTTRYSIRQAEKVGVLVEKSVDIDKFVQLYEETMKRQGFVGHKGIREEYEVFHKNDMCDLFLAEYQGKTMAGALIIYFGQQAIYHHGASIASKIPASYILQWQVILEAKKRSLQIYNFWGIAPSNKPNHPWQGITLFKKGFGGREIEFIHAQDLSLSPFYKISYSIELIRRLSRGY